MATAIVALANVTLGASASSVTFSSISQSYRDLILVTTNNPLMYNSQPGIRFNSDGASNYTYGAIKGDGSTTSFYWSGETYIGLNDYSSDTAISVANVLDYSATDKHKTVLVRSGQNGSNVTLMTGRWANTSAITTLTVMRSSSDQFVSGSTFALYGVLS